MGVQRCADQADGSGATGQCTHCVLVHVFAGAFNWFDDRKQHPNGESCKSLWACISTVCYIVVLLELRMVSVFVVVTGRPR